MTPYAPSRRLKIGLNLRSSAEWAGGHHYVLSWVNALAALPDCERPEVVLLYGSAAAKRDAEERSGQVSSIAHLSMASRMGIDFVYPVKEIPEAPSGVPWGGWIVDWQQRYLPELFSPAEHVMREFRYRTMLRSAPVVAHSSAVASEGSHAWVPDRTAELATLRFRAMLDEHDLRLDPAPVPARYGIRDDYVIVCNQWFRHKNHATVIEALGLLRARGTHVTCVITGRPEDHRWPDHVASIMQRIDALGLGESVHLVGSVPRPDQIALLRGAALVVQPSLFEGWSSIVEEARALGKPIVLSDIPVHREQAPPDAAFFDPTDSEGLARRIQERWPPDPRRASRTEAEAMAEHLSLQREAGRELLALAEAGRRRYDRTAHDPARILRAMVVEAAHLAPEREGDCGMVHQFVGSAVAAWFTTHPWRWPGFAADLLESDPVTLRFARAVVLPALVKVPRHWRTAAATDPLETMWWDASAIDVVARLARLDPRSA